MNSSKLFVGIDVALAKNKKLPICVVRKKGEKLFPVALEMEGLPPIPRGSGNVASLQPALVSKFARDVGNYICAVETLLEAVVEVIAIDAPADYSLTGRREGERALNASGIRCFATPTAAGFKNIREKVKSHLEEGGAENRLPHGHQLWMLAGFALFRKLQVRYRCLEVFPQAIVHRLGVADVHKFKKEGLAAQLGAVAMATGWTPGELSDRLKKCVPGAGHDRLDAYMCAWVASEYPNLDVYGKAPDDAIWVPKVIKENSLTLSSCHVRCTAV